MRKITAALAAALLAAGGVALAAAPAVAGSDSPTPYTVTEEGITLAPGDVFRDSDHVNVRYTSEGVGISEGVHFEAKCVDRTDAECAGERHDVAQYIGKSFLPWSVFEYGASACVEWVQISMYDEHYGEGGQPPIGPGCSTPTPTPTDSPSPTPTPTETSTPEPTETPEPTTTPRPTATATAAPAAPDDEYDGTMLPATGANPAVTIWGLTGAALAVAVGALLVVLGIRARTRRG